jgi:hypothetical protein
MPSKYPLLRIGPLALAFCSLMIGQMANIPKVPLPSTRHAPTCLNCVRDMSGHISRNPGPVRAFRALKPCPATKSVKGACSGFVVDYIKPLNRGGSDTPDNMQWLTMAQATKGRVH